MMSFYLPVARKALQFWAQMGRAPGILHQVVDQHSRKFAEKDPLVRQVYQGNKILCNLNDHVQSRIYFFGAYEPIEAHLFLNLIEPESHVVDAGANIGFYSLLAASQVGERGQVHSFEPVPFNYNQLLKNIEMSQKQNITVHKLGLWNQDETLTFSLDQSMNNNHGSFTAGPVGQTHNQVECPVTRLDRLLQEGTIKKVDLVKMDIEGAELMALQGALNTIDQFESSFLMEINQGACQAMGYESTQIDEIFLKRGYKIFLVNTRPEDSGFIKSTQDIRQSNVFYISPKDMGRFTTTWNPRQVRRKFACS
jgi:FkbM family methyltransferase